MAKDRVDRDEEDLVRLYLSDIGQYTLLTKDDEVRLAKQIEDGKAAKDPDLAALVGRQKPQQLDLEKIQSLRQKLTPKSPR